MIARTARGFTLRLALVLIASAFIIAGIVKLYEAQPPLAMLPNTKQIEHGTVGDARWLQRLPHAREVRSEARSAGSANRARVVGSPARFARPHLDACWFGFGSSRSDIDELSDSVRNGVRREPDARSRDGLGGVERESVHSSDARRTPFGRRSPDPPADALAFGATAERRGSARDVRVSAITPADPQPRTSAGSFDRYLRPSHA